jgi:DUF1680 family protein
VGGKPVKIVQENNYPWEGNLKFTVVPKSSHEFSLRVRIPGWADEIAIPSDLYSFQDQSSNKTLILINGTPFNYTIENGYAVLNRLWKKNDVIEVRLPMEVRRVIASGKLKENEGKVALQRGPLMYCAEWPDNNGRAGNLVLPQTASFTTQFNPALLNGVTLIKAESIAVITDTKNNSVSTVKQPFTAIPYYAWANRGKGEMTVWFPTTIKDIEILTY